MKLTPVKVTKKNRQMWCGPFAFAAVRHVSYDKAYEDLLRCTGKRSIRGMYTWELLSGFAKFGYLAEPVHTKRPDLKRPTFAQWLRAREDRNALYLVVAGHHFIVVQGNKQIDTFTLDPVFISKSPHRRKRVSFAWKITKEAK